MVTVLMDGRVTETSAEPDAALWIEGGELGPATGWVMKPEGLCKGELCVPIPRGERDRYVRGNAVNVSAYWALMEKPAAASASGDVWALGEGAESRNSALLSLEAPDFTLPDFDGKPHSLSDFRRNRVLLITWASW